MTTRTGQAPRSGGRQTTSAVQPRAARWRYRLRHGEREVAVPRRGEVVVGRAADCALRIGSGLVSRHHARFLDTGEALLVEDLGSRNGVLVNDHKIAGPTPLSHGDVVGVGLERLDVIDDEVLDRPEHLSTIPPPVAAAALVDDSDAALLEQETGLVELDALSDREREVLELIVLGHTQREVAERLHVSVKTVETHRARIADKLGCRTRAELVTYAISAGMLGGLRRTR